jgi:hypothetical protein
LKVCLPAEEFFKIQAKIHDDEKICFVEESDSIAWLERCMVGGITKLMLDEKR